MSEMSSPAMNQPAPIPPASAATSTVSSATLSPKKVGGKLNVFSHIKYEHMMAGISGKRRFAALPRIPKIY